MRLYVALVVVFSMLATGCASPPPPVGGPGPPSNPVHSMGNVTWAAGQLEGDLAIEFAIRAEKATCRVEAMATGLLERPGRPFLLAWENFSGKQVMFTKGQSNLETYAGGSVDGQRLEPSTGAYPVQWAYTWNRTLEVEGSANVTVAVAGLHAAPEGPPTWADEPLRNNTFYLRLGCDSHFDRSLRGSRDLTMFGKASMNGTGAWADAVFDPKGASRASIEKQVDAQDGALFLDAGGDLLLNRVGAGTVDIKTPKVSETWILRPRELLVDQMTGTDEPYTRLYHDGPGTYSVTLTYAATDTANFDGCILGLSSISTLDDLL